MKETKKSLSVQDVARLVQKPAGFVRQHLHRGHLRGKKGDANRVSIQYHEAIRWAEKRGLAIDEAELAELDDPWIPAQHDSRPRIARICILAGRSGDQWFNLATTVRHREGGAQRVWEENLSSTDRDIALVTADLDAPTCAAAIVSMQRGSYGVLGKEVLYKLEDRRSAFVGRDMTTERERSSPTQSPFAAHSASLTEFWCFDRETRALWDTLADQVTESHTRKLALDLPRYVDRLGNVLVFEALDEVRCTIKCLRSRQLRLETRTADTTSPSDYSAHIFALADDDVVVTRRIALRSGVVLIPAPAEVGTIGFTITRESDGRCVDHYCVHLVLEMNISAELLGPENVFLDRQGREIHRVQSRGHDMQIVSHAESDRRIRYLQLERRQHEKELTARAERNLARFGPTEHLAACAELGGWIRPRQDLGPVYLLDRYFLWDGSGERDRERQFKMYIEFLSALRCRPLRILCYWRGGDLPSAWRNVPAEMQRDISIKSLSHRESGKPVFHDRCLATSSDELVITHSFSGWAQDGVTFVRAPYGVYFAEAERLWAVQTDDSDFDVRILVE